MSPEFNILSRKHRLPLWWQISAQCIEHTADHVKNQSLGVAQQWDVKLQLIKTKHHKTYRGTNEEKTKTRVLFCSVLFWWVRNWTSQWIVEQQPVLDHDSRMLNEREVTTLTGNLTWSKRHKPSRQSGHQLSPLSFIEPINITVLLFPSCSFSVSIKLLSPSTWSWSCFGSDMTMLVRLQFVEVLLFFGISTFASFAICNLVFIFLWNESQISIRSF